MNITNALIFLCFMLHKVFIEIVSKRFMKANELSLFESFQHSYVKSLEILREKIHTHTHTLFAHARLV